MRAVDLVTDINYFVEASRVAVAIQAPPNARGDKGEINAPHASFEHGRAKADEYYRLMNRSLI